MNRIKTAVHKQITISKLKKEAKVYCREHPQFSLMECQNIIAQKYGYLHWHELDTLFKSTTLENHKFVDWQPTNNILLGTEYFSHNQIYLTPYFDTVNVEKNQYCQSIMSPLMQNIISQKESIIMCLKKGTNNTDLEQYSKDNKIPCYYLSFYEPSKNNMYFDLNKVGSGGLSEILYHEILKDFGKEDIWIGRAIGMFSSAAMAWSYLSSIGEIDLTPEYMREGLVLDSIVALSQRRDLPPHIIATLKIYLKSLPGYTEGLSQQPLTTLDHHGYLQMQYIKALFTMTQAYPFMFQKEDGKLDFRDILEKQEKCVIVVDLPDNYSTPIESVMNYFNHLWQGNLNSYHSNKTYKSEQNYLHYKVYLCIDDIPDFNPASISNPLRLPFNFIFLDKEKHGTGTNVIPQDNSRVIVKPA